jgi:hypothetical protein
MRSRTTSLSQGESNDRKGNDVGAAHTPGGCGGCAGDDSTAHRGLALRFYDRLGGTVWAEKEEVRPDFVLPEVAYVWGGVSMIYEMQLWAVTLFCLTGDRITSKVA